MIKLIVGTVLTAATSAHAAQPYSKLHFENQNWRVIQVGLEDKTKQCALMSSPRALDSGGNLSYGYTYMQVSYPSNNLTFSGEKLGAYFRIAKGASLRVGQENAVPIVPEQPIPGKPIVDQLLKLNTGQMEVTVSFDKGDPSVHGFPIAGFAEAYAKLAPCSGSDSKQPKTPPTQRR